MNAEFFPATLDRYKGLVKFVYIDYPLVEIHPWAMHAAVNANCLAAQNGTAYWNYVDYLHTHGQDVSGPDRDVAKSTAMLDKLADQEGARDSLDAAKLDACVAKQDDSEDRGGDESRGQSRSECDAHIFCQWRALGWRTGRASGVDHDRSGAQRAGD